MPFSSAINWRISITQNWWLVSLYLCSSDVGEAEQRTGSRNKKTRKLVGASADSKRKKKDTQLEQDAEQGQLQEDLSPIPESEIVSHPTGTYIEDRGVRCQHTQRHLANLTKNAQRISSECGWSVSIVAFPPESATKRAAPLELLFPDKNGRQPPTNSKRVISAETPKPSLVERGTQFYQSLTGIYEKILTPTKTRESLVQDMLMEDSYISPLGTSVLSLQVHDIQDALDILPVPNIVIDGPEEAEDQPQASGSMHFTTPYNHSTVYETPISQGFCVLDQTTNTSIGPVDTDSIVDQSNSRRGEKRKRDDLSYVTPTKTAVTTTTTTGVVTCQSMQTLTVPDRVLDSLGHPPFEPRFIFAHKSLQLGKKQWNITNVV